MKRIEKAVEKQKATFQEGMTRFEFNYRLVRKLLRPANLPLPPCSQILPFALGSWNIMKPSGDMITQMIWSANYHPPINNAQTALVKKLRIRFQCTRSIDCAKCCQDQDHSMISARSSPTVITCERIYRSGSL
mmetsp:Transcript_16891/g.33850  ORF Transcript_16891/g.33850 Transcript_16891/m.33850 type:complete len:133 (-) Transcript_16891:1314-1712(-)